MAIMARVTFLSLCFVASDLIAEGSAIAPQVSELSRQKSFSSIIQQSRQESEIASPGVAGKRVGSGFKILKSPSASGLHKLCSDIDVNGSTLDAGDPRQPEPTLLDLHSGEHVENVQDPCEQQSPKHPDAHRPEAACLPKNLLKPLIKVCESQLPAPVVLRCSYNSWAPSQMRRSLSQSRRAPFSRPPTVRRHRRSGLPRRDAGSVGCPRFSSSTGTAA